METKTITFFHKSIPGIPLIATVDDGYWSIDDFCQVYSVHRFYDSSNGIKFSELYSGYKIDEYGIELTSKEISFVMHRNENDPITQRYKKYLTIFE